MNAEDLERFNPWWKTNRVKIEWLKEFKRKLFFDVERFLDKRQIVLIWGLRRLGKTTLLFQLIDGLLKKVSSKNVLYFSFDEISFDFKEVLEDYQKIVLNKTFDEVKEKIWVFFDEVHKVKDWENKLKVYYDLYPNVKFFVSGSASVALRKKSNESLAGRVFDFVLKPLDFEEFLEMSGMDLKKIRENPDLWKREILPRFHHYIKFGMFPELVNEENEEIARKYLLNNVIERIIYKDLPEEFELKDIELLKNLVFLIGKKPGMILNYKAISKDLGRDQRTIANYFEYLEFGLLVKFVFNYRGSPIASVRKMKKAYLASPNIAMVYNQNLETIFPFMLENLVLINTNAKFFYKNGFEIDFIIIDNDKLIGIEVKQGEKDINQIKKFVKKFGKKVKKVLIVSLEKEEKIGNIEIIPIWKFLLQKKIQS